jgi:Flp pilus assembly protein TadG
MTPQPRLETYQRRRHRRSDETGSMAIELAVLTVPLVAILLLVAAFGRFSDARNQVTEAARDAAREASTYLAPAQASSQADQIARSELTGVCAHASIRTDTSQLHPGGQVTVTVTCPVPLGDLSLLDLPGIKTITASSVAVVDTYVQGQGSS